MWLTVNVTLAPYFGVSATDSGQIPLPVVQTALHNLLRWAENLPEACVRNANTPHHVLTLQYVTFTSDFRRSAISI